MTCRCGKHHVCAKHTLPPPTQPHAYRRFLGWLRAKRVAGREISEAEMRRREAEFARRNKREPEA